jgi:peptidoglycan/xylan/chitin deacetylase (PgdA/CDA1 family)
VALTFDDGYREILDTALPVLVRHQAPATVFMPTGFAGCTDPERLEAAFRCTKPVLGWDDIRAMRSTRLIEIECHTHTHLECVHGITQMVSDISTSLDVIEQETGRRPRYFAYPNGVYNAETNRIAQRLGFRRSFSTKRARLCGGFTEGRFDITRRIETLVEFRRNLAGFNRDTFREMYGSLPARRYA